jgi:hypothetical protein
VRSAGRLLSVTVSGTMPKAEVYDPWRWTSCEMSNAKNSSKIIITTLSGRFMATPWPFYAVERAVTVSIVNLYAAKSTAD